MTKRDFFSRISGSWEERHAEPQELERLRSFSGHFHLQPGERVLDAGCGSGRLLPVIGAMIGPTGSLVELDFAPGMLAAGRGKPHGDNVTFILGDAHALPFPDRDFDRVIALALLPHLDDKGLALREFHRVLKPGGWLIIAHQMGREALDQLHGQSSEPVKHDRLPEKRILNDLLSQAGFSAIEILDEAERYVARAKA
jgi:ubiquinone/menaquinone biosynthesis C-methylase UbiE